MIYNGSEIILSVLTDMSAKEYDNTSEKRYEVTEEEQRKGFQCGSVYVVGKTYKEYENQLRYMSLI